MLIWHGRIIQHGGQSSHVKFSVTKSTRDKVVTSIQDWLKTDETLRSGMRWWPDANPVVWGKGSYDIGYGCGPYDIEIKSEKVD